MAIRKSVKLHIKPQSTLSLQLNEQPNQTTPQYMKKIRTLKPFGLSLAALALVSVLSTGRADTLSGSYTNKFDTGGNTNNFSGSGSVASWIGWYGSGYNNTPLTNNVTADVASDPNSGSLILRAAPNGGDQIVYFGTIHNNYGYDF